jgi:hypothetical protein
MSALADPVAAYPVKTRSPHVTSTSVRFGGLDPIIAAPKPHLAERPS